MIIHKIFHNNKQKIPNILTVLPIFVLIKEERKGDQIFAIL